MTPRETELAPYRPKVRPLVDLSNEELQALFEMRASKVKLDPKGFWDNPQIVYWHSMIPKLMDLYEIMLEIQARYPKAEVWKYGAGTFPDLLPVHEKLRLKPGLVELKKEKK